MLDVAKAAKGFFVPCRLCNAGVGLVESANGEEAVSLTDNGCLIFRDEDKTGKKITAVICGDCLFPFRDKTIVAVGTMPCFQCYRDRLTVIYTAGKKIYLLGGQATYQPNGRLTLFSDVICNDCLKRLGFWAGLKRRLEIWLWNMLQGGGSSSW